MTSSDLISFVHNFNKINSVSLQTINEALTKLPAKDHELLMLLVNYKNGADFLKKLKGGKI